MVFTGGQKGGQDTVSEAKIVNDNSELQTKFFQKLFIRGA